MQRNARALFVSVVAVPLSLCTRGGLAQIKVPECKLDNISGYTDKICKVNVARQGAVSETMTVPNGTKVQIVLTDPRWDESVSFNTTTTELAPQDVILAVLKNFITPLQSVVGSAHTHGDYSPKVKAKIPLELYEKIDDDQATIEGKLTEVEMNVQTISNQLSCLETYQQWDSKNKLCTTTSLTQASFIDDKNSLVETDLPTAIKQTLPIQSISDVGDLIKTLVSDCKKHPSVTKGCENLDAYQTNQQRYGTIVTDVQKQQDTLNADLILLASWNGTTADIMYQISQPRNRTSVVTITTTEVVSKTATTVATVTITWQSSPWIFSTGIMFSSLINRAYSITPVVSGGVVQTTPPASDSGSPTINQQITENDTAPSIIFPLALVSYRFNDASRKMFKRCPNHCGLLITAGVGPNLTSKTTDFVGGLSFQYKSMLFTPVLDYGRENFLSGGLVPNQPLPTPPSALPQHTEWTPHWGISLSYVIPMPQ